LLFTRRQSLEGNHPLSHVAWLAATGVAAFIIGSGLIVWGWRLAKNVQLPDPYDPNEPRMKF
jgi:hypothetical protein